MFVCLFVLLSPDGACCHVALYPNSHARLSWIYMSVLFLLDHIEVASSGEPSKMMLSLLAAAVGCDKSCIEVFPNHDPTGPLDQLASSITLLLLHLPGSRFAPVHASFGAIQYQGLRLRCLSYNQRRLECHAICAGPDW